MNTKDKSIDELLAYFGDYHKFIADLSIDEDIVEVKNDKYFNAYKDKNIGEHEVSYTKILKAYAINIETTLERKRRYKTLVFWLSYALLIAASYVLGKMLFSDFTSTAEWWAVIAPSLASFLTVFIVIPKVITEYLFNAEEEKYMSEIIKNIQNYDKK